MRAKYISGEGVGYHRRNHSRNEDCNEVLGDGAGPGHPVAVAAAVGRRAFHGVPPAAQSAFHDGRPRREAHVVAGATLRRPAGRNAATAPQFRPLRRRPGRRRRRRPAHRLHLQDDARKKKKGLPSKDETRSTRFFIVIITEE